MSEQTPAGAYRLLHERVTGAVPAAGDRSLSAVQYDAARAAYLAERGAVARRGVAAWPPTSQTLMRHLGGGSWACAVESLGLRTNSGRSRGAGAFTDGDYRRAVADFLTAAADSDDETATSASFASYTSWARSQSVDGHKRPSGAAVRQHFGAWEAAKAAAG